MDLKLIRNLVRIMERGEVDELEIEDDKAGLRVHLRRGPSGGYAAPSVMMMQGGQAPSAPLGDASLGGGDVGGPAATEAPARAAGVEEITSPMIGTFYSSPSPEADAFTQVGERVGDESVVCIIEAMKVMNEIKAEVKGTIAEVLVEDGKPVEYGQALFRIEPN
jgi:acetyl-CoA carboxylase biotin carboxyl carrier protein